MKNELVTFIDEVDDLDVEEFEVVVKNRTKQKETKWQAFKKAFKSLFCCCCCNEKYRPRSVWRKDKFSYIYQKRIRVMKKLFAREVFGLIFYGIGRQKIITTWTKLIASSRKTVFDSIQLRQSISGSHTFVTKKKVHFRFLTKTREELETFLSLYLCNRPTFLLRSDFRFCFYKL